MSDQKQLRGDRYAKFCPIGSAVCESISDITKVFHFSWGASFDQFPLLIRHWNHKLNTKV